MSLDLDTMKLLRADEVDGRIVPIVHTLLSVMTFL
jgi:hypothetical protein